MLFHHQNPKVSVIIPCYNHGIYLQETLRSIDESETVYPLEVIIVNDGSTDEFTNTYLKKISKSNYKIIFQDNQGVGEARNVAVKNSTGEYVLPVDADNMIRGDYIQKAVTVLDSQPDKAIVYCNAVLIGDETGISIAGPFNLQRLMLDNFIDNCSLYRRAVWEQLGGYESSRTVSGLEDWDFWLRAAFAGYKFHYLDEALFEYRILANSGIRTLMRSKARSNEIMDYFLKKMPEYYGPNYVDEYIIRNLKKNPPGFLAKLIMKAFMPKQYNSLVLRGKLRKYL